VDVAAFIVSIVAVLVSAGSVFYARRLDQSARAIEKSASKAADAASNSADAAYMSMWIESDRHHRERRPRLTARFAWLQDDLWQLHITLHIEDSPLSDMTVDLLEGQWIVFKPGSRGVPPPAVDGGQTLRAVKPGMFGADLLPGESLTWLAVRQPISPGVIRMNVRCVSSNGGEEWRMAFQAPVEAPRQRQ
jgi:hypothetical protein